MRGLMRFAPFRFAAEMADTYFSKRVARSAAELSYWLTLTFFPIIICVSAFLDVLNIDFDQLILQLQNFLPESVTAIFREYVRYISSNQSTAMLIGGLLLTLLFASAAVRALMNVMQDIYGRATFRGLRRVLASLIFALLFLAVIYLSLAVVVTGNWFFHTLGNLLGLEDLLSKFALWQWLKYVILLGMVFLFILLLYRFSAPLDHPRPPVVPGALLASLALAGASMFFSLMVGRSTQYSLVYGSLASVIIMLVWLYLCGNVLILGSVFNYVLYRRHKEKNRKTD